MCSESGVMGEVLIVRDMGDVLRGGEAEGGRGRRERGRGEGKIEDLGRKISKLGTETHIFSFSGLFVDKREGGGHIR
jgi:hypothetical protein